MRDRLVHEGRFNMLKAARPSTIIIIIHMLLLVLLFIISVVIIISSIISSSSSTTTTTTASTTTTTTIISLSRPRWSSSASGRAAEASTPSPGTTLPSANNEHTRGISIMESLEEGP